MRKGVKNRLQSGSEELGRNMFRSNNLLQVQRLSKNKHFYLFNIVNFKREISEVTNAFAVKNKKLIHHIQMNRMTRAKVKPLVMPQQTSKGVVPNMVIVRQNISSDCPAIIQPCPEDDPSMPLSTGSIHEYTIGKSIMNVGEVGNMDQIVDLPPPLLCLNDSKGDANGFYSLDIKKKRAMVKSKSIVDIRPLHSQKPSNGKPLSAAPTLPTLKNGPTLAPLKVPITRVVPSPLFGGKRQNTPEERNFKRRKVIGIIERTLSDDAMPAKPDVIADAAIALSELHRVPQSTPNTPEVSLPFSNALPPPPYQLAPAPF